MTEVLCPYCEEDILWQIMLDHSDGEVYFMCFECDTIWMQADTVMFGTGTNYELFMKRHGKEPDWSIINKIKPLNIVQIHNASHESRDEGN